MRPTIPLGPWRLAIELAATRAINARTTVLARNGHCARCLRWASVCANVLPDDIRAELRRIGIEPARPSDVYVLTEHEARTVFRARYHCVGQILSGPPAFHEQPGTGRGRRYAPIAGPDRGIGMAVAYQDQIGSRPTWAPPAMQPLIAIDLWLTVTGAASGDTAPPQRGDDSSRQAAV